MNKLFISMAATIMATACSTSTKEEQTAPQSSEKTLFVESNVPAQGLDIKEFSSGIQHVGVPTAEVQKTIDFYKGLGFNLATRHDINGRDFAFMQLGNLLIEVIPTTSTPAMCNGAVDHFCLDVKNVDTLYQRIKDAGYTMLSDSVNYIDFWDNGAKYFFIQGPNNEKIEFCEIL